ncbi:peptidase T, partial [gut metagenome]
TSPEAKGGPVNWRIVRYQGKDIVLDAEKEILLSRERFPELDRYHGQDLVVTDGHTLLGADDKAGIAAIMTMVDAVTSHPDMPHAKICLAFTPDEEVGRGTENFDIQTFGADYAYTVDGGELGELNSETFCAAIATVTMKGVSVHPGSAKNKMINALRLITHFIDSMPPEEVPEKTEGYEGFYHPIRIEGGVEEASLLMLIRDHDRRHFELRKRALKAKEADYQSYGEGVCTISIKDQYFNMREYLDPVPAVMEIARAAYRAVGVTPRERPVRGGTDGSRLSERGLPCPNLFTGGLNFHGIYECLPVESLEKA